MTRFIADKAEAMQVDGLVDEPRFVTNADRVAHREELNQILRTRFQEHDSDFWVAHITKQGVPNSRVNRIEYVLNDPQTEARVMIASVDHARLGTLKFPACAVKLCCEIVIDPLHGQATAAGIGRAPG
jgi:crotonobetainyl-CoA:carnitine CoA-transferase CaiB-like acyl-CoA transferase